MNTKKTNVIIPLRNYRFSDYGTIIINCDKNFHFVCALVKLLLFSQLLLDRFSFFFLYYNIISKLIYIILTSLNFLVFIGRLLAMNIHVGLRLRPLHG